jgi:serine/threonine-protein kinase
VFLERGLALDPKILEGRAYLVFCHLLSGEKARAREQIASLRHDAPNNATMHFVSGVLYRLDGEYKNAISSFQRMLKLNPSEGVVASWNTARIYMYQGLYDEALSQLDEGALLEPNHPFVRAYRGQVLFYKGNSKEAATLLREVLVDHPEINAIRPLLAVVLSAQGKHEAARAILNDQVKQAASVDWDVPYWLASAYAMEGERSEALEWLNKAISLGNENLPWFRSNPVWKPFFNDEKFMEIMRRVEASQRGRAR